MNDAALAELVRQAVRAEVEPLRRLVEALAPAPPLTRPQRELLAALELVMGKTPFASAETLEVARVRLHDRPLLAAALAALGINDAHRLGMVLGELVKRTAGQPLRLVRAGSEGNSRMWAVEKGTQGA